MHRRIFVSLTILVCLNLLGLQTIGQSRSYQTLLDTVFSQCSGFFIHSKPLRLTRMDSTDLRTYFENFLEDFNKRLDTGMFLQIIRNSKKVDTSVWRDEELPANILVGERDRLISKRKAIQKLSLKDKNKLRTLKKEINRFNATSTFDRNLYHFSRPVFDDSKSFAVIEWDNADSSLGGGGGIKLYHFENGSWHEAGVIKRWNY